MRAVDAQQHSPPMCSCSPSCACRPLPQLRGPARSTLATRRGRTRCSTRDCAALGLLVRAGILPWWLGCAASSTLASVVETTLAPVVTRSADHAFLRVRRIGGSMGPVAPSHQRAPGRRARCAPCRRTACGGCLSILREPQRGRVGDEHHQTLKPAPSSRRAVERHASSSRLRRSATSRNPRPRAMQHPRTPPGPRPKEWP